ncbi:hypothetical protein FNV43_RR14200 [Rhamnella rubrinervis]|uniref:Rad21/Rec8-like protein N-terminal domain-containing protein n=1 Tax=Rhamnella rubrinervis TaxID=2594499 RepID=A0A8K0H2U9_9ROSA|nr:hypothetical protein FNV43_RR14200 [Rhamnella rubrinervis]
MGSEPEAVLFRKRRSPMGFELEAAVFTKRRNVQDALFSTASVPFNSMAVASGYMAAVLAVSIDVARCIAHRALGYLLLGVVRISSKEVDYLSDGCHGTLIGINDFVAITKGNADTETLRAP